MFKIKNGFPPQLRRDISSPVNGTYTKFERFFKRPRTTSVHDFSADGPPPSGVKGEIIIN